MELDLYQIDAFTHQLFHGNPACVVPLPYWLPDAQLLQIAEENAVAETAFFVEEEDKMRLRWFTPEIEMDLCGHATLATAHCLKTHRGYQEKRVVFETLSGPVAVDYEQGQYVLEFPSRPPEPANLPENIMKALSIKPKAILKARDYVLIYEQEADVKAISVNKHIFDQLNIDPGCVVVTAPGTACDFVSRVFTPQASILEDPVTGSAHCSLIPYWAKQLQKKQLSARQLSFRGGVLACTFEGERVRMGGSAMTYFVGKLYLNI